MKMIFNIYNFINKINSQSRFCFKFGANLNCIIYEESINYFHSNDSLMKKKWATIYFSVKLNIKMTHFKVKIALNSLNIY